MTSTSARVPTYEWRPGFWIRFVCVLFLLRAAPAWALDGNARVHDPSTLIKCDGVYYVFSTGRGIPYLTSTDGFTWQRGGKIFDKIPDSVLSYVPKSNGMGVWAPEVIKLNGQYYVYYAVSAWGQFVSAIGLITNPTLNPQDPSYHWTDRGMVVHSVEGENLNAIDPGVIHAPDGTLWLSYGSYHGNIELVQLNPDTGLRISAQSKVWVIASRSEASNLIYHGGYYYLFVNHGSCCSGTNSTYHICVGRSTEVTGPYLDRHSVNMADGGGSLFLGSSGRQIGPGQFGLLVDDGVEKFSCHYEADLDRGGRSALDIRPMLWTASGWPAPGEVLRDGTYQIRSQRTDLVLETATSSQATPVQCGDYLVRSNQQWAISQAGGGFYTIFATGSNALETSGSTPGIAAFSRGDNQLWSIDELDDGSYRIASKIGHLALAATYQEKPRNGVSLAPWPGDDAERWAICPP